MCPLLRSGEKVKSLGSHTDEEWVKAPSKGCTSTCPIDGQNFDLEKKLALVSGAVEVAAFQTKQVNTSQAIFFQFSMWQVLLWVFRSSFRTTRKQDTN